jgi:hypothetical protein
MPDHQARPRAVYDHTDDEQRPARRRRKAADWGVGEEIFDHMPSRRFARRGEEHEIPRGGAEDGRRTIVIERDEPAPPADEAPQADEAFGSREEALRARRAHDAVWGGDEPFADAPARAAHVEPPAGEPAALQVAAPRAERTPEVARGGVEGRRTVKIGGRPGELYGSSERRRPPRTVHERLGPRPDRIAAWACALGLLLILIAILTQ